MLDESVINLIGLRFVWAELIFRGLHHAIRTRCLCRKGWHLNKEQHNLKRKITCRHLHERARIRFDHYLYMAELLSGER